MKNKVFYIILFYLLPTVCFSQEEELFILLDHRNIIPAPYNDYKAFFVIESKDPRFDFDVYNFYILKKNFGKQSLYDIGKEVSLDTIHYINPSHFNQQSACETHIELSLKKQINIVSKIHNEKLVKKKDEKPKYMVWDVIYYGTLKDLVYTDTSKK